MESVFDANVLQLQCNHRMEGGDLLCFENQKKSSGIHQMSMQPSSEGWISEFGCQSGSN